LRLDERISLTTSTRLPQALDSEPPKACGYRDDPHLAKDVIRKARAEPSNAAGAYNSAVADRPSVAPTASIRLS